MVKGIKHAEWCAAFKGTVQPKESLKPHAEVTEKSLRCEKKLENWSFYSLSQLCDGDYTTKSCSRLFSLSCGQSEKQIKNSLFKNNSWILCD